MKPYYEDESVRIYHGDAMGVLLELPRSSADVLITDPPYSSGGMMRGDRIRGVHAKYLQSGSFSGHALGGFSGDGRDQRSFAVWVSLWLSASLRVVSPGGIAALFTDWRQLPIITDALQAGGYVWRGIVPWHKPAARPTQGRWANSCEYVAWGTNGARPLDGTVFPGFYEHSPPSGDARVHIAQKPLGLLRDMLLLVPDEGTVLDPFIGSGTTLRAAKDLGRKAIGIEIEERYCEIAAKRMAQRTIFETAAFEPVQLEVSHNRCEVHGNFWADSPDESCPRCG